MSSKMFVFFIGVLIPVVIIGIIYGVYQFSNSHLQMIQKVTATQSDTIQVTSPKPNQEVGKSFEVSGKARVFENVVSIRLINQQNKKTYILAVTDAKSKDVGQFGNFTYTINLSQTSMSDIKPNDQLLLEVFQQSPKDGQKIDKVQIPLIFQ